MIRTQRVTVTVSGADGSAEGNATTSHPMNGRLVAVHLDHTDSAATADVTITTLTAPIRTLLVKSDSNADAWFFPLALAQNAADGADLTAVYAEQPVDDYLKVAVAQSNAGTVTATFYVEC